MPFVVPSAAAFAKSAVAMIGYDKRTTGYWSHALQATILELLPRAIFDKILTGMHLGIRKRALRKKN